jgi:hypothetical protein
MTGREPTAYERGVSSGHYWAELYEGDKRDLYFIADGEISPEFAKQLNAAGFESDDVENPFWRGFARGVRIYLGKQVQRDS